MAIVSYATPFPCGYVDVHTRHCLRRALRHPSGDAKCFGHWIVADLRRLPAPRLVGRLAAALAFYDAVGALAHLLAMAFPALAQLILTAQPSIWHAVGLTAAAALAACVTGCLSFERAVAGRLMPVTALWLVGMGAAVGAMLASGRSLPGFLDGPSELSRFQGYYMLASTAGLLAYLLGMVAQAKPLRILVMPVPLLMIAALAGASVSAVMLFVKSNGSQWEYLAIMAVILVLLLARLRSLRRWVERLFSSLRV